MVVSREPIAAGEMTGRPGQQGVPVIDMDGKILAGVDGPKIHGIVQFHCQVE